MTSTPGHASVGEIAALRQARFDDRSILDATQVLAYFNFVNRSLGALGVQGSASETSGHNYGHISQRYFGANHFIVVSLGQGVH